MSQDNIKDLLVRAAQNPDDAEALAALGKELIRGGYVADDQREHVIQMEAKVKHLEGRVQRMRRARRQKVANRASGTTVVHPNGSMTVTLPAETLPAETLPAETPIESP